MGVNQKKDLRKGIATDKVLLAVKENYLVILSDRLGKIYDKTSISYFEVLEEMTKAIQAIKQFRTSIHHQQKKLHQTH